MSIDDQKGREEKGPSPEAPIADTDPLKFSSKRQLFRKIFTIGVGTCAAVVADNLCRTPFGNVVPVKTQHGDHTIIYSNHSVPNDPRVIAGTDGIILEGFYVPYEDRGTFADRFHSAIVERLLHDKQLTPVFLEAAKQKKPLFLVDLSNRLHVHADPQAETTVRNTVSQVEMFLGAIMLIAARAMGMRPKSDHKKNKFDRRAFLKRGLQIAGVHSLSPGAEYVLGDALNAHRDVNESAPSRIMERMFASYNNVMHPELVDTIAVEGRNALFAQKSETVASILQRELGRRPQTSIIVGGGHFGIEEELKRSERQRLGTMGRIFGEHDLPGEGWILRIDPSLENDDPTQVRCNFKLIRDSSFGALQDR